MNDASNLKISIVTPSYNQGRYIEKAILSVMEQDYQNFEHIIYDNCSSDETRSVIEKYPHVTCIFEKDEGQSDALNKGFYLASGDIIGWLNADDFYLPGAFQKVDETFRKLQPDAIYSNVKFVDQNGEFKRNLPTHRPVKWMSLLYTYIQSTSFFFKKDIIKDNHVLDKNLHLSMDMEFFARLLFAGYQFKYVNDYFACFRWHETNKSGLSDETVRKNMKEIFYILNKVTKRKIRQTKANEYVYRMAVEKLAKPIRQILIRTRI